MRVTVRRCSPDRLCVIRWVTLNSCNFLGICVDPTEWMITILNTFSERVRPQDMIRRPPGDFAPHPLQPHSNGHFRAFPPYGVRPGVHPLPPRMPPVPHMHRQLVPGRFRERGGFGFENERSGRHCSGEEREYRKRASHDHFRRHTVGPYGRHSQQTSSIWIAYIL